MFETPVKQSVLILPSRPQTVQRVDPELDAVRKLVNNFGFETPGNTPGLDSARLTLPDGFHTPNGTDRSLAVTLTSPGVKGIRDIAVDTVDPNDRTPRGLEQWQVVRDAADQNTFRVPFRVTAASGGAASSGEQVIEHGFIQFRKVDGEIRPTAIAWVESDELKRIKTEDPAADGIRPSAIVDIYKTPPRAPRR